MAVPWHLQQNGCQLPGPAVIALLDELLVSSLGSLFLVTSSSWFFFSTLKIILQIVKGAFSLSAHIAVVGVGGELAELRLCLR